MIAYLNPAASNIRALIQELGARNQMLHGNSGFLDIVARVAVDGKILLIVEKLHPERQVIGLRQFRWLQQSDLIDAMPRQGSDFLAIDRSGCAQDPHIGLNDQAFEMLVLCGIRRRTIEQGHDRFPAYRRRAVQ